MKKEKQKNSKGKVSISFDDVPTKLGNQGAVQVLVEKQSSPEQPLAKIETQKKGIKRGILGGLRSPFMKQKPKIDSSHHQSNPSISPPKKELSELEKMEAEIEEKKKLLEQKKEEERLKKADEERLKLFEAEQERARKRSEEIQKKKADLEEKKKKSSCSTKVSLDISDFSNLQPISLIPDNIQRVKTCEKCGGKMKKKWVKMNGNIYTQTFICKNKLCKNIKVLEIGI